MVANNLKLLMTHNADLGKDKSLEAMDNAFVFALGLHAWIV